MFLFFTIFISWIAILFAFATSSLAVGVSLFANISPFNLIPYLPYWCGAVIGVSFASLAMFSFVGTYYNHLYLKQMYKSYIRFHKNTIAISNNKPTLPSHANHPILSKKASRILRNLFLFSLNLFSISLVIGYLVCSLVAKSLEWWHVFEWWV